MRKKVNRTQLYNCKGISKWEERSEGCKLPIKKAHQAVMENTAVPLGKLQRASLGGTTNNHAKLRCLCGVSRFQLR